jgi:hypothetical protein
LLNRDDICYTFNEKIIYKVSSQKLKRPEDLQHTLFIIYIHIQF